VLLVSRRRALHVPLFLITFSGGLAAFSIAQLIERPGVGMAFGALLTLALFIGMTLDVRTIVARNGELSVRAPFRRHRLKLASCAFSVRVEHGGRGGATYTVYASDGITNADISDHWSTRRADRALARIERAMLEAPCRETAEQLAARRFGWESAERDARARVDAYYKSPTWRWTKWIMLGVFATLIAVAFIAQFVTLN
jgi:hypothetical protein